MTSGKLTLYLSITDGAEPQKRAVKDAIATIKKKKDNILFVGFSEALQAEIQNDLPPIYKDNFFSGRLDTKKETLQLIFSSATKAVVFNNILDHHHQKFRLKLIIQLLNAGIDVFVPASLRYFALCSKELKDSFNIENNTSIIPSSFFKYISRVILINNFDDSSSPENTNCPIKDFLETNTDLNIRGRLANMAFILATHINYHSRYRLAAEEHRRYTHLTSTTLTSLINRALQIRKKMTNVISTLKIKIFNIFASLMNILIAFFCTMLFTTVDADYDKILMVFLTSAIMLNLIVYSLLPTIISILFGVSLTLYAPEFIKSDSDVLLKNIGLFIGIFLFYIMIQNKKIIFQQKDELSNKESRFNLLYKYTETLATATSIDEIFRISEKYFKATFNIDIILILQNPYTLKTQRVITSTSNTIIDESTDDISTKQFKMDQYEAYDFRPLISDSVELGWLGTKIITPEQSLDPILLNSSVLQITIALQRYHLSQSYQSAVLNSEKEQLRSVILSSISHDLKTPLTTIIGSCTALEELENLSNKNKMILIHAIHEASDQLNQFISNILDSSRLATENILQQTSLVYLDDVINVILHRSKKTIRLFDVSVTVTNSEEAAIYGDFTLIQQVFYNIIENATKYIPIGGKISIFITNIMDKVFVRIYDNGPGIIESKRNLIFDKFYRFQHSDQQKAGTGLGLSICKQIIEAYNGKIWASDRDDGQKGAQFNIELPCAFPQRSIQDVKTRILK
ncbi:ATP-binding protein [Candidatus Bodocaedibacter vickermanii]|uniref:histidine kinase n=1 Tax=Candidatus Bodocaedibacter vickermanii TaxID=2741701 RepID=A0A7L9RV00_9PROT|nr:Sensor protein KdpD [Candidatus Paracaedibacteraceae bacterium 'Lake Konstanz']